MIEIGILKAGYGLDHNGFIVSDVSKDKIDDVYVTCIHESIAIRFNGDIDEVLRRTLNRLTTASGEDIKAFTQSFARKLIRTYYSMVMVRSQIWTTRLHEQAEVILQHFPEKESVIRTLLHWIDEPPTDREAVYELFKFEGEWAGANFLNEAKTHG
ncbi:hypothetical protein [Paenibacillus lautus]|uniref:hypothetical protein n=1 Tax=Paenibacillus lautus TaxID=1401 RepID=UPI003D9A2056